MNNPAKYLKFAVGVMLFAGLMAVPLFAHSKVSVAEEVDSEFGIRNM